MAFNNPGDQLMRVCSHSDQCQDLANGINSKSVNLKDTALVKSSSVL